MKIELDEATLNRLAAKTAKIVLRQLRNEDSDETNWIGNNEAAKILGIKPAYLRQIHKNFTCIKRGSEKQGRLFYAKHLLTKEFQQLKCN